MSDDTRPHIQIREDGPFVVKGVSDLTAPDGSAIETRAVMPLCRCGASKDKPFCDGTHREIGFAAPASGEGKPGKVHDYVGEAMTVHWNSLACSHAAKCVATSRAAFDPDRKPWIDADQPEAVLKAAVAACPSGALSWAETATTTRGHGIADGTGIRIEKDGPLEVTGIPLPDDVKPPEGVTGGKYVLCRCGHSSNKPFCDGSHADKEWDGTLAAGKA